MQRFVVGTGRCGSTLLSNMLACHPDGLMISECLGAPDRARAFKPGLVSADELKDLLRSNVPVIDLAVRRGNITKEQLYKVEDQSSFTIPAFLYITFPALTDKPDELFTEMMDLVGTFPDQSMAEHYLAIFSWLQQRFGKSFWIERSGSSIEYMPELYRLFPQAKYVHIHRDGPDAAISMFNHFYFQMLVSFFCEPATMEELEQTELGGQAISMDDPISQRLGDRRPDISRFAEYWNYQLEVGFSTFARMDGSSLLDVRFEDLVAQPADVLRRIADFLQLPSEQSWIETAAAMVDPAQVTSSPDKLAEHDRHRLLKACEPGRILLGRYQHPWIFPTLERIREISLKHLSSFTPGR